MRDRGNDSFLLLGASDGSLAIVRAPFHGKWMKLLSFVRAFVLFDVFPPLYVLYLIAASGLFAVGQFLLYLIALFAQSQV